MNDRRTERSAHLLALVTIVIWGATFISTELLLVDFQPVEILFIRFLIGFFALLAAFPHRLKHTDRKQEITFALAGLCGITLYYLFENIALTFTQASNIGVIVSAAPLFTAILSRLLLRSEERLGVSFFLGFLTAMAGIALISFHGAEMHLDPRGDLLAVGAAIVWSFYSILTKKISAYGFSTIQTTRRIFAYGILFMIPFLLLSDFKVDFSRFANAENIFHILFLGLGASALCFATWSFSVKVLGVVRTSVYIYMVPVVTVILSVIVLKEEITWISVLGTVLILLGLLLSSGYRPKALKQER